MKCFYHEENAYVGDCTICGKHLCKSCFDVTVGHVCIDCVKVDLEKIKIKAKSNIIAIIFGIIVSFVISYFIFWESGNIAMFVTFGISFVPNYLFLGDLANKILGPRIYNGAGILIAFAIKCLLAYLLCAIYAGAVISLYYIIRNIYVMITYEKNFKVVTNNFENIK